MDIVVLAGGLSSERDVSFSSGANVAGALRKRGHRVILLDAFMGYGEAETDLTDVFERSREISVKVAGIPSVAPDIEAVKRSRKDQSPSYFGPNVLALCAKADMVFMALHGEDGENGKVQAAFDLFGIRYTGTDYLSSALAMHKEMAKRMFRSQGIPTPKGIYLTRKMAEDASLLAEITYPCVVKPCCGGSSVGVSIVSDEQALEEALTAAFSLEEEVLVEEYIQGREFSVGVMEGKALPVIEIAPVEGFYDYANKYKAGAAVETCPALLSEELTMQMQKHAEAVVRALGLSTYCRMDFLLKENGEMYCLEANTLPGMTATSLLPQEAAAVGISYEELCERIIEISLKKYEN